MKYLLFNPFEKYRTNTLLIAGLVFTILGTYLGFLLGVNFDGALDVHLLENISVSITLKNLIVNFSCLFVFFSVFSKLINLKSRFIDIIVFILISRIPLYLISFFNVNNLMVSVSEKITENAIKQKPFDLMSFDGTFYLFAQIISLIMLIWYIALLFNGFKISSNAKEGKGILFFVLSLLFAEITSKYLFKLL